METFILTFGVQYPREPHPVWTGASGDGWVEVIAPDYGVARRAVVATFGTAWSMLYDKDEWTENNSERWYPLGCIGAITAGLHGSDQVVFVGIGGEEVKAQ